MFSCNPVFAPVLEIGPEVRYIDLWGGRGRGGSHFATEMALALLGQPAYFRGYFMRATYRDIRESLWQDFRDRYDDQVERGMIDERDYYISDATMTAVHLPTGNTIKPKGFRKSDKGRTAKLKSLAGATHVFIEECEEVEELEFMQLDDSLRTVKSPIRIFRIFNPPKKNHWLMRGWYNLTESKQKGYYVARPKQIPGFLSIFSTYHYNASNLNPTTIQNFESYKVKQPEYYWTTIRGLISEGAKGRVYSGWQPITAAEWDAIDAVPYVGLDFGYSNDPVAAVAIKRKGNKRYIKPLIYETELDDETLAKRLKTLGCGSWEVFCDSDEPKSIAQLKKYGIRATGAAKGKGSRNVGIKNLKACEVFYVETDENFAYEYQEYRWALDAEKNPTDQVVEKHDHYMDATRYGEAGRDGKIVGKGKVKTVKYSKPALS
ncbi:PBSX family phage terminase large subunit [Larkinella arboricola]